MTLFTVGLLYSALKDQLFKNAYQVFFRQLEQNYLGARFASLNNRVLLTLN